MRHIFVFDLFYIVEGKNPDAPQKPPKGEMRKKENVNIL